MKFIHTADIHASKARLTETLKTLAVLNKRCSQGDIDYIIIAGDFFDSTITNTKASGFSDIIQAFRSLSKKTKILMCYGTASHEPDGCLEVFQDYATVVDTNSIILDKKNKTAFMVIPEPRRSHYQGSSLIEIDGKINKDIVKFVDKCKKECPEDYVKIVVYHGEVKGAMYQNGMTASSPTAIDQNLLMSLNANYYALGHIHMPQSIFKNCWYSGSPAPKDFGEKHKGIYNVITVSEPSDLFPELNEDSTNIEVVEYGFPENITVRYKLADLTENFTKNFAHKDWSKYKVKIIAECTQEEAKTVVTTNIAERVKYYTHAQLVKVDIEKIVTTNIRSKEISERRTPTDKMKEYVKVNKLKEPKHTYELLSQIEDNMLIKYVYPSHNFELVSASVKGAIGIKDGTGLDEITIDFSKMTESVFVIVGDTGKGKSTLIENCQPFPRMLTRTTIAFKDNFYLKDSHRILVYKDESGQYYKLSMLIDGKNKTGIIRYFAQTSVDNESWKDVPGVDGSLDAYSKYVTETFGTIDVFLRTAFITKEQTKGISDISTATKGEKMELFSKLAGTDSLKDIELTARELGKKTLEEWSVAEEEYKKAREQFDSILQKTRLVAANEFAIEEATKERTKLKKEVETLVEKDNAYKQYVAENKTRAELHDQYRIRIKDLNAYIVTLDRKISDNEAFTDNHEAIETLRRTKEQFFQSRDKHEEVSRRLLDLMNDCATYQNTVSKYQSKLNTIENSLSRLNATIERLTEETEQEIDICCPTCLQKITKEIALRLSSERQKKVDKLNDTISDYKSKESEKEEYLSKLSEAESLLEQATKDKDEVTEEKNNLMTEYRKQQAVMEELRDFDKLLSLEPVTSEELALMKEESEAKKEERNSLAEKLEETKPIEVEDVSKKLAKKQEELEDVKINIIRLQEENKIFKKELEGTKDKMELRDSLMKRSSYLAEVRQAYEFIEKAFSNKGIQALELESSAPDIADICNEILRTSYGDRFTVSFETLRKNKQGVLIDDFNILVFDSQAGRTKPLDIVSSGEKIWIKQALYYAFGIVRQNRTGFCFQTQFIDEADSSLDSTLRPKYFEMVNAAHKAGGAKMTVLITHSQEIKDIAPYVYDFNSLKV